MGQRDNYKPSHELPPHVPFQTFDLEKHAMERSNGATKRKRNPPVDPFVVFPKIILYIQVSWTLSAQLLSVLVRYIPRLVGIKPVP